VKLYENRFLAKNGVKTVNYGVFTDFKEMKDNENHGTKRAG
jgi:phosphoribosylamine-glycine ligase